jgi:hypothetical protein
MDVSSIAAAASANALGRVQAEASLMVLKKAMDLQSQSALQLLQAVPAPVQVPDAGGSLGGVVDTWV